MTFSSWFQRRYISAELNEQLYGIGKMLWTAASVLSEDQSPKRLHNCCSGTAAESLFPQMHVQLFICNQVFVGECQ